MKHQVISQKPLEPPALDLLDRAAVGYVALPVVIFLLGWFKTWLALILVAGLFFALRKLVAPLPASSRYPVDVTQIALAVALGSIWVYFSGIDHFVYANADWYTRDAVLHDLVSAQWPVVYELPSSVTMLLRAPLGFYMPAAIVGKLLGLRSAHLFLAFWAAVGTVLFLLQAMSLSPARFRNSVQVSIIAIFFSGMDFVGSALNWGPRFFETYDVTSHIEWWAGSYQYSAMTTQLFWVPNHALAAWIVVGLLARSPMLSDLDALLPMLIVCAAVWSPLSASGLLPFVGLRIFTQGWRAFMTRHLRSASLIPALLILIVVGAYYAMDAGKIDRGLVSHAELYEGHLAPIFKHVQFFVLEAGFLGFCILVIQRSSSVIVALVVLLVLPIARLGPGNDLVMRASIPSLVVLLLASCAALQEVDPYKQLLLRKLGLAVLLSLGALTSIHEFARAIMLKTWPINLRSSLIAVSCGAPPHYVAEIATQPIMSLLKASDSLPVEAEDRLLCMNPAFNSQMLRERNRSRRNTQ